MGMNNRENEKLEKFVSSYVFENKLITVKKRQLHKKENKIEEDKDVIYETLHWFLDRYLNGIYEGFPNLEKNNIVKIVEFIKENNLDINKEEDLLLLDLNFKDIKRQDFVI